MEDNKIKTSADDFEQIVADYWDFAFNHSTDAKLLQAEAILIKSIERLRVSTEQSAREANRLSSTIKKLTAWLVGLTVAAVALAGLSVYVLFRSAK
jgi:hypothetical protein